MIVGSLGKTIFGCSSHYIKTINNLSIEKSAKWTEFEIINNKPKLQFNNSTLDKLKFDIHLNAIWNVNCLAAAKEFEDYMKKGKVLRFILGGKIVGNGLYVIESISENYIAYSPIGTVIKMGLSLQLKEYN